MGISDCMDTGSHFFPATLNGHISKPLKSLEQLIGKLRVGTEKNLPHIRYDGVLAKKRGC